MRGERGKAVFLPPQGKNERVGKMEGEGELGSDAEEVPLH